MPDGTSLASIAVDRTACMGSGTCIMYAPGNFTHDDETKAVVMDAAGDPIETHPHRGGGVPDWCADAF